MIARAIFNKTPLPPNRLCPLPLGAIEPQGWLGAQLSQQAQAIADSLAQLFPGAQGESAWLGGPMADQEQAVEALCSLTWIAYVTGQDQLKGVVARFVDWAVNSQKDNGDFGPPGLTCWWPKMLMLRVMRGYFLATGDKAPLKLMDRFFRYQLEALPHTPLSGKACARAAENMLSALWLYNLTEQKHLIKLCELLAAQALDWTDELHIFPHIRDTGKQRPWPSLKEGLDREGPLDGLNQKVNGREYHLTNAVDVAFGLKTPGVVNLFKSGFKEVSALRTGWPKYMKQHGVALSMFAGDNHLAGANPSRGVNLSALSETIQSLATLMATGDEYGQLLGDLMEKLALNIPAAWAKRGAERQALIQVNQLGDIDCPHGFYNAPGDALCMKARPLDLADQALSAYASSLWYATSDDGLAGMGYAPCAVNFVAGGERVRLTVEGGYPFSGQVTVRVETRVACEFPVYLRIPGWAGQVMIKLPDGELMQMQGGETACVRRKWAGEATIEMDLNMEPRLTRWFHQSAAVELGPMLMALDLEKESAWNWALDADQPMKAQGLQGRDTAPKAGGDTCQVLVKGALVAQWEQDGADCAPPPIAPQPSAQEQVLTLVPFASTDRRIAQFPVIRRS